MNWKPMPIHDFAKSENYREVAVFNDQIDAVASRIGARVESYEVDGLGLARGFCLRSDANEYAYLEQSAVAAAPDLVSIAIDRRCSNWAVQVDAIASIVEAKGLRWVRFEDLTGGL
jgi:hypothetical protein